MDSLKFVFWIFQTLEALPDAVLQEMRSSQEKAQAAILYHATPGRILTNKIKDSEVFLIAVDTFFNIKLMTK